MLASFSGRAPSHPKATACEPARRTHLRRLTFMWRQPCAFGLVTGPGRESRAEASIRKACAAQAFDEMIERCLVAEWLRLYKVANCEMRVGNQEQLDLGFAYYAAGHYAQAVKALRREEVGRLPAKRILAASLAQLGQFTEAHEEAVASSS
jgi:hypothetical protein